MGLDGIVPTWPDGVGVSACSRYCRSHELVSGGALWIWIFHSFHAQGAVGARGDRIRATMRANDLSACVMFISALVCFETCVYLLHYYICYISETYFEPLIMLTE